MVCKQIADLKCKQTAENEGIQGDIGYLSLTWISLIKGNTDEMQTGNPQKSKVNKQLTCL